MHGLTQFADVISIGGCPTHLLYGLARPAKETEPNLPHAILSVNAGFGHTDIEMATLMNRYTEKVMAMVPMIRKIATTRTTDREPSVDAVYDALGQETETARTRKVEEPPRPPLAVPQEAPGDARHGAVCLNAQ